MSLINKQNKNGDIGEIRTERILKEYFLVSKRNLDIDGEDFIVEIPFNDRNFFRKFQEKGVVQAKYFEKNNEIKIAREYVEDEDGIRTNFFALIHTDDQLAKSHYYFFTAEEIKDQFKLRKSKKEYFVFRLSKSNPFNDYKDLPEAEIIDRIEECILKTEEYRRQKLIREVEEKFRRKTRKIFESSNVELYEEIKEYHIIDKISRCLNVYNDFRRIISWRLIDKISFREKHNTSTFYNEFTLKTDNTEILNFFKNLEIGDSVQIKEIKDYGSVNNFRKKIKKIISTLNQNLINRIDDLQDHQIIDIHNNTKQVCNCSDCLFKSLNFYKAFQVAGEELSENAKKWDLMRNAYVLTHLGKHQKAKPILSKICENAKKSKQPVLLFFAKFNLRIIAWKGWEDTYPNLETEINFLNISDEKREILRSVSEGSLTKDYANSIDEIYLKIKDFKQRTVINDTDNLIRKLYSKFAEYTNFHQGNYLINDTTSDFKKIGEKVIESFIVSYSMRTNFTKHIDHFNDFIISTMIHQCEASSLIKWFQRNEVKEVKYSSEHQYFEKCINNFFSNDNIEFLRNEIVYTDNRTKNPDLRRKTENIFNNICILIAYLKIEIKDDFLKKVIRYIEYLDMSVHNISLLAHPLIKKPETFKTSDIVALLKILIKKDLTEGYLITNCLLTLQDKGYIFNNYESELIDKLIENTIDKPSYGSLKTVPHLFNESDRKKLIHSIDQKLLKEFDPELYTQAVLTDTVNDSKTLFNRYIKIFENLKHSGSYLLFGFKSPYTGIDYRIAEKLNDLVNIYYKLDNRKLSDHPTITKIRELNPYYEFIFSLNEDFIDKDFKIEWLLENQSDIILKRISNFEYLKNTLEVSLQKEFNPDLSKLYFKCFVNNT